MGQGGQLKRERDMKRIFVSVAVCATLALAAAAVVVLVLFALRQARVADGLVNFFQKLRSLRRPAASADGKKAEDAGQNGPDGEVG